MESNINMSIELNSLSPGPVWDKFSSEYKGVVYLGRLSAKPNTEMYYAAKENGVEREILIVRQGDKDKDTHIAYVSEVFDKGNEPEWQPAFEAAHQQAKLRNLVK